MAKAGLWMDGAGSVALVSRAAGTNTRPVSRALASCVVRAEVRRDRLSAEWWNLWSAQNAGIACSSRCIQY